jgi:hypothetical protein
MSRLRETKRLARRDVHRQMAVPALYLASTAASPVPCTVRVWRKRDDNLLGDLQGMGAVRVEPEDRLRFDLTELVPRRLAIVSVEAGEAYRIEHTYPADCGYQTARVTPLDDDEAVGLPVPS